MARPAMLTSVQRGDHHSSPLSSEQRCCRCVPKEPAGAPHACAPLMPMRAPALYNASHGSTSTPQRRRIDSEKASDVRTSALAIHVRRAAIAMFRVEDRNRVRDRVLTLASGDPRVVAGAVVGSLALHEGDRWSDLDLTFAVAGDVPVLDILDDWTRTLAAEFGAVTLFDLPAGASLYRVFLLPGCLQFDLSFTPVAAFGATSPKFRLLFGEAVTKPYTSMPPPRELFGYAVHHALRARFCIERGRVWQAEYWLSGARDAALHLACLRHDLPARDGRGFDDLPADVLDALRGALARSLDPDELLRALGVAITGLLHEAAHLRELAQMAAQIEPQLRELTRAWGSGLETPRAGGNPQG